MRERPDDLTDAEVLAAVRRGWLDAITRVDYLPVGFGAHHWAAYVDHEPTLFVTYDPVGAADRADLVAAYDGARALSDGGLEFVLAPRPTGDGHLTTEVSAGLLCCSPWHDGRSEPPLDVRWATQVLRRLHAADPPARLPRWRPKVGPGFGDETAALVVRQWGPGPYAEQARADVRAHLDDVARWTDRYHHLAGIAERRPWVACHGEPHHANQLQTERGRFLVDWDTLRLAPAELDLRVIVEDGVTPEDAGADREMLELFDLEWRLDEISQYAAWFAAPHSGTADDEIAIGGLHEELARPDPSW